MMLFLPFLDIFTCNWKRCFISWITSLNVQKLKTFAIFASYLASIVNKTWSIIRDETGRSQNWLNAKKPLAIVTFNRPFQSSKDPHPHAGKHFLTWFSLIWEMTNVGIELAKISQLAAQSHPWSWYIAMQSDMHQYFWESSTKGYHIR